MTYNDSLRWGFNKQRKMVLWATIKLPILKKQREKGNYASAHHT